jgi:hypothetical protein
VLTRQDGPARSCAMSGGASQALILTSLMAMTVALGSSDVPADGAGLDLLGGDAMTVKRLGARPPSARRSRPGSRTRTRRGPSLLTSTVTRIRRSLPSRTRSATVLRRPLLDRGRRAPSRRDRRQSGHHSRRVRDRRGARRTPRRSPCRSPEGYARPRAGTASVGGGASVASAPRETFRRTPPPDLTTLP